MGSQSKNSPTLHILLQELCPKTFARNAFPHISRRILAQKPGAHQLIKLRDSHVNVSQSTDRIKNSSYSHYLVGGNE
ncbi:MAG: hypothetical protein ACI91Z_000255 [Yoonia sp.]|jgi:hypothetical protein